MHRLASIGKAQLPSFHRRAEAWLADNVEITLCDLDPTSPNNVIVAIQKEPLPLSFIVEADACINAMRSSLDILATALAYRHNIPKPEEAYFRVAVSEAVFRSGGYKGAELIKALAATERALFEALKPYKGGNESLWALHRLDIVRKHTRLLETAVWPEKFSIMGWGLSNAFTPLADFVVVDKQRSRVGSTRQGTLSPN